MFIIAERKPKEFQAEKMPKGQAFDHLCIDIETGHASDAEIAKAQARWQPPSNLKDPEKIKQRQQDDYIKIAERSALLDGSPITCIGVATEKGAFSFSSHLLAKKFSKKANGHLFQAKNEYDMLMLFRDFLDANTTIDTTLIGFNLYHFDLPRLRYAYLKNRLILPRTLQPKDKPDDDRQPSHDVMFMYLKWFTSELEGDRYVKLEQVIDRFGLPGYKNMVSGAEVPDMWKNGKYEDVISYCQLDAIATYKLFLLMTSQSEDMT